MSDEYIEVSAKTLEDAISEASQKLSVTSDMLDVEVVDQGSSGFLGFNAKPAIIRAKAKKEATRADHVQGDVLSEVHKNTDSTTVSDHADNHTDDADASDRETEYTGSGKEGAGEGSSTGEDSDSFYSSENAEESGDYDHSYSSENGYGRGSRSGSGYRRNGRRSYGSSYTPYGQQSGTKTYVAHSRSTDDFLSTTSDESRSASRSSRRGRRSRQGRYDSDYRRDYDRGYGRDAEYAAAPESGAEGEYSAASTAPSHEHRHDNEPKVNYTDEQVAGFEERAKKFLTDMFRSMDMEVNVSCDFDHEENILTVDFEGDDMGVLIGKRGQTLDSIQYLVSLVVNRGIPGYVHVKADTENYRERRKKTLENLAKNMAAKVKRTRRSQALEPMNPYERRIIHSALQGDRYVTTYSEGEDPYRRVVITLKK